MRFLLVPLRLGSILRPTIVDLLRQPPSLVCSAGSDARNCSARNAARLTLSGSRASSLDSECQDPSPPSQPALRRQASKVGAVCSNAARTELCGGAGTASVPTATKLLKYSVAAYEMLEK